MRSNLLHRMGGGCAAGERPRRRGVGTGAMRAGVAALSLALAGRADAVTPDEEVFNRYKAAIDQYARDLEAAETRYRAGFVGKPTREDGSPSTEEKIFSTLRGLRARVAEASSQLAAARRGLQERKVVLADFLRVARQSMQAAASAAAGANTDETGWRVQVLQIENIHAVRTLEREFGTRKETLRGLSDAARASAHAALVAEYTGRERAHLESALRRYQAATRSLVARRRVLCGDVWALSDFHTRRGQDEAAEFWSEAAYRIHAYDLAALRGGAATSALDFFAAFPGSPDRLILRMSFVKDVPSLHRMTADLAAEPVESLRRPDASLPALNAQGTELEQIAMSLSARLVRFYVVADEQEALFKALRELNAQAGGLPETTPDLSRVAAAFKAYGAAVDAGAGGKERSEHTRVEVRKAREAVAAAERALRLAQGNVFLADSLRAVAGGTRGARRADERLESARRSVRTFQQMADDPATSAQDRQALRDVTIPRLQNDIKRIESAVKNASERESSALEKSKRDLEAAEARLAGPSAPPGGRVPETWNAFFREVDDLLETLTADLKKGVPRLPLQPDPRAAAATFEALRAKLDGIEPRRRELSRGMADRLGRIQRAESELALLARSIATLRLSAVNAAERALAELGARPGDEALQELGRLRESLGQGKDLLETADGRLDSLEKMRAKITGGDQGAKIIEKAKARLGTVVKTLDFLGRSADMARTLDQLQREFSDSRTSLQALATLLDSAAGLGGHVPVIGDTFGAVLGFYAEKAAACAAAAVRIQDHLIEQDLRVLFNQPSPERHLYTNREVAADSRLQSEDARRRIATMLQVRRLLFLTRAASRAEAQDSKR